MIEFMGVNYRYPGSHQDALANISLTIDEGQFVLLAGPSGGGKSTLLRTMNGLVPHLSGGKFGGRVLVNGHDTTVYGPRVLSRVTGFVFQDPDAQAVAATVEDEIAFSMEQMGVPRTTMRLRVEEMLDLLGLAHLRTREVTTLSGGERQRVAVAGAMALQPRILVLDEPTSQLDPWGADDLIAALQRLNEDLGLTIVVAEHRLDRLLPAADRLMWLENGAIRLDGRPCDVAAELPGTSLPPAIALADSLGKRPLPLTIKDARLVLRDWSPPGIPPVEAPSNTRTVIELSAVSFSKGRSQILNQIDFAAGAGEVVALMGRNGSGKTTLLRTIFGFVKPTSGAVRVLDLNMATTSAAELGKLAAYLPQRSSSVLFNETIRAEIDFTCQHRGSDARRNSLIEILGLAELLDKDPRDLSEGQRLRAALAAILVGDPKLVLLDEPTRGLDGEQRARLVDLIRLMRDDGACVVLSTHDVELAAMVADRVVLLGHGQVVADGSPREVLTGSLAFSTQINRLFGPGYLTLADVGLPATLAIADTAARN